MKEFDRKNTISGLATKYGVTRNKVATAIDVLGITPVEIGTAKVVLSIDMLKLRPALTRLKNAQAAKA